MGRVESFILEYNTWRRTRGGRGQGMYRKRSIALTCPNLDIRFCRRGDSGALRGLVFIFSIWNFVCSPGK